MTELSARLRPDPARSHGIPIAVLAEITHRCPLQCPYCSNPVELERASAELSTEEWLRVLGEIADLGVLQLHFSGGEPLARRDLETLVARAAALDLYTNLITSAVTLTEARLDALAHAGLDHVQISVQSVEDALATRIGGLRGALERKRAAAAWVRARDLPLTLNAVMHRQNLHELPEMIEMALDLGAARLEVANVQYYGWALRNRAALMPTPDQIDTASKVVDAARARLHGRLVIDYVEPDYYAARPKPCMGGWGRQVFNISPSGKVLPCHAAESIAGLSFDSVRDHSLAWIWDHSKVMNRYRGTDWMPEPCRSCAHKHDDWGGCRCQAAALLGDGGATDPACAFSPRHAEVFEAALAFSEGSDRYTYRDFSGGTPEPGG
ncbi:pyrroloquinoline quinone biosynthesis protein PqqE [Limimaricola sp. G21655-S1]|uniref:pyrroloquinoline quinone biosynthesis protein PqqE n=1 Tax=Limimaricola sp. G21655-S1 TaxID=3014768 RepID=UPI0022AEC0E9|nr:pyrroloquinoline quinone biosynthesis protein PqqE [Limimaricola sp. G21655-S1]MCZ4262810.1 pyrroloquinoline quinone biosynthesis protein PqqE [Limimaricola sp. G21655-S1]